MSDACGAPALPHAATVPTSHPPATNDAPAHGRHLVLVTPAGSYRTGDNMRAAAALGCAVTVVTDAAVAIPGSALTADLADPERAAEDVIARLPVRPDGVVGTDGAAVAVAGALARRLALPANPAHALRAADDKRRQRLALAATDVPQPAFTVVEPGAPPPGRGAPLPAVVKPVDRTASQGVLLARTVDELAAAVARVRSVVGASAPVLVERFVPGDEVTVDALLRDGRLQVLAVFDKPDAPAGPTFPETLLITPARVPSETLGEVIATVERAAGAIGLTEGPVHVECRIDDRGRVWFLELAARTVGGLCGRALRFGDHTLEQIVLRHALGLPLALPPQPPRTAAGVLMMPAPRTGTLAGVEGVEHARSVPGVCGVTVTAATGQRVVALPDGDRYLGFVFARAATADAVEDALRAAWARLRVEVIPCRHTTRSAPHGGAGDATT